MTQHKLTSLVLMLAVLLLVSCRQTDYGTSLSIQNQLDNTVEVEVFPIESPYSPTTKFSIPAGQESSIHNMGVTEESPLNILAATFDSVKIHIEGNENIILFTPDTVIYYLDNPYTDIEMWQSKTVDYEECSMRCVDKEDLNHYFGIESSMISNGN
jgi:hypothetical protein